MKEYLIADINKIPYNIRKAREYRNYTQEYLAYKLSISQNAYSKIELGYTKLTIERLYNIAYVLEFDIVDLLNFNEQSSILL